MDPPQRPPTGPRAERGESHDNRFRLVSPEPAPRADANRPRDPHQPYWQRHTPTNLYVAAPRGDPSVIGRRLANDNNRRRRRPPYADRRRPQQYREPSGSFTPYLLGTVTLDRRERRDASGELRRSPYGGRLGGNDRPVPPPRLPPQQTSPFSSCVDRNGGTFRWPPTNERAVSTVETRRLRDLYGSPPIFGPAPLPESPPFGGDLYRRSARAQARARQNDPNEFEIYEDETAEPLVPRRTPPLPDGGQDLSSNNLQLLEYSFEGMPLPTLGEAGSGWDFIYSDTRAHNAPAAIQDFTDGTTTTEDDPATTQDGFIAIQNAPVAAQNTRIPLADITAVVLAREAAIAAAALAQSTENAFPDAPTPPAEEEAIPSGVVGIADDQPEIIVIDDDPPEVNAISNDEPEESSFEDCGEDPEDDPMSVDSPADALDEGELQTRDVVWTPWTRARPASYIFFPRLLKFLTSFVESRWTCLFVESQYVIDKTYNGYSPKQLQTHMKAFSKPWPGTADFLTEMDSIYRAARASGRAKTMLDAPTSDRAASPTSDTGASLTSDEAYELRPDLSDKFSFDDMRCYQHPKTHDAAVARCVDCETVPGDLRFPYHNLRVNPLIMCQGCGRHFHKFCTLPQILPQNAPLDSNSESTWFCVRCVGAGAKPQTEEMLAADGAYTYDLCPDDGFNQFGIPPRQATAEHELSKCRQPVEETPALLSGPAIDLETWRLRMDREHDIDEYQLALEPIFNKVQWLRKTSHKHQMKWFNGWAKVYRDILDSYAEIADKLHQLAQTGIPMVELQARLDPVKGVPAPEIVKAFDLPEDSVADWFWTYAYLKALAETEYFRPRTMKDISENLIIVYEHNMWVNGRKGRQRELRTLFGNAYHYVGPWSSVDIFDCIDEFMPEHALIVRLTLVFQLFQDFESPYVDFETLIYVLELPVTWRLQIFYEYKKMATAYETPSPVQTTKLNWLERMLTEADELTFKKRTFYKHIWIDENKPAWNHRQWQLSRDMLKTAWQVSTEDLVAAFYVNIASPSHKCFVFALLQLAALEPSFDKVKKAIQAAKRERIQAHRRMVKAGYEEDDVLKVLAAYRNE